MSLEVFKSQLRMMNAHLENANNERVRAVILGQISQIKRNIAVIQMQPALEYQAQIEAKYANTDETQKPTRGRKKKEVTND